MLRSALDLCRLSGLLRLSVLGIAVAMTAVPSLAEDRSLYELQTYAVEDGRLGEVVEVMGDHAVPNWQRHGIELLGAWTPINSADARVVLLFKHADKATATSAWQAFQSDADWRTAIGQLAASGNPIQRVNRFFLTATDYSPSLGEAAATAPRAYELRTYITTPGNLPALHQRFQNHTLDLFSKHGMQNLPYWTIAEGESTRCGELVSSLAAVGSEPADVDPASSARGNALVYLLSHASDDARVASFDAFRQDADWKTVLTASEQAAGGPLTAKNGVKSLTLQPTAFSPLQ